MAAGMEPSDEMPYIPELAGDGDAHDARTPAPGADAVGGDGHAGTAISTAGIADGAHDADDAHGETVANSVNDAGGAAVADTAGDGDDGNDGNDVNDANGTPVANSVNGVDDGNDATVASGTDDANGVTDASGADSASGVAVAGVADGGDGAADDAAAYEADAAGEGATGARADGGTAADGSTATNADADPDAEGAAPDTEGTEPVRIEHPARSVAASRADVAGSAADAPHGAPAGSGDASASEAAAPCDDGNPIRSIIGKADELRKKILPSYATDANSHGNKMVGLVGVLAGCVLLFAVIASPGITKVVDIATKGGTAAEERPSAVSSDEGVEFDSGFLAMIDTDTGSANIYSTGNSEIAAKVEAHAKDGAVVYCSTESTPSWYDRKQQVRKLNIVEPIHIESMSMLTAQMPELVEVSGLANVDLSGTNSIFGAFQGDTALESADVNMLDVSGVEDMEGAFLECYSLKRLDVSTWDVSSVKNMASMFAWCGVEELDLSSWRFKGDVYADGMFLGAGSDGVGKLYLTAGNEKIEDQARSAGAQVQVV
jgi:surface protein